jgi:hypothetical protein
LGVQSCSSRIVAKGGALYNNASWDLVDKSLEEGFDWEMLSLSDLPEVLREIGKEERNDFIEAKRAERERIQLEIQRASAAREVFVQQALAERLGDAGLGDAMRRVIREQAKAKGFTCEDC